MNRCQRSGWVGMVVAVVGVVTLGVPVGAFDSGAAAQQSPLMGESIWKLDEAASTNPNGPATGGRRGQVQGNVVGGGDLGREEAKRHATQMAFFHHAPAQLGIKANAEQVMIVDFPNKRAFSHKTDNKNTEVATPAGPVEAKLKWDKAKMVREVNSPDTLKIVEEYEVSADGKTLTVTLETSSRMVRDVGIDIVRVYTRVQ